MVALWGNLDGIMPDKIGSGAAYCMYSLSPRAKVD